ncbi:MAG: STM3941 family protein [Burkholderiales bacterium]
MKTRQPDPDPLVIPLSKTKLGLLLLGAAAFVALGIWLYLYAGELTLENSQYVLRVRAAAVACVGFFGLCAVYAGAKLFDNSPGLIIDAEGLVDNSSGLSAGRIPWSDIKGVGFTTVEKQRFLTIVVHDPHKYVRRASPLMRPFVTMNMKLFGSPIQISANTLKVNFDDLMKAVTDRHARYGRP